MYKWKKFFCIEKNQKLRSCSMVVVFLDSDSSTGIYWHSRLSRSLYFWKNLEDYDIIEHLFKLNDEVFWKFLEVCDAIEPLFVLNCEVCGRFSKLMTSESLHLFNINVKFWGFPGKIVKLMTTDRHYLVHFRAKLSGFWKVVEANGNTLYPERFFV